MAEYYFQDKLIEKVFSLEKGNYENCIFRNCDWTGADFSDIAFTECTFQDCNFSLVKLNKTGLRDVKFTDCKMLGLHFDTCNSFGLSLGFDKCQLNHSSFYKLNLKNITFRNSDLREADFSEADLSGAVLADCNLELAVFDRTNLEKADLRTAYNYSIDPENNRIKGARFSVSQVAGLLTKYNIIIE